MVNCMSECIYIFNPGLDQALAIARLLRRYYEGNIIGVTLLDKEFYPCSRLYDSIIPASWVNLNAPDIRLIPTGALSTRYLLELRGDITLGQITLKRSALRVYDKLWIIRHAQRIGIPVPITWSQSEEIPGYPVFYKPAFEKGGGNRGIAYKAGDLPKNKNGLIFQEVIQGKGTYGVAFLAEQGKLLAYEAHYEVESYPKPGGSAIIIERFYDQRLIEYSQRLLEALGYSGWGLIEFKYCPYREDYVFMEVNAKFWASCEFTFRNNPLFLKLLFDIDSKEKPIVRMFFVERAAARGLWFLVVHFVKLLGRSELCIYPGWPRRFFKNLILALASYSKIAKLLDFIGGDHE